MSSKLPLFLWAFQPKPLCALFFRPVRATCPVNLILIAFITLIALRSNKTVCINQVMWQFIKADSF